VIQVSVLRVCPVQLDLTVAGSCGKFCYRCWGCCVAVRFISGWAGTANEDKCSPPASLSVKRRAPNPTTFLYNICTCIIFVSIPGCLPVVSLPYCRLLRGVRGGFILRQKILYSHPRRVFPGEVGAGFQKHFENLNCAMRYRDHCGSSSVVGSCFHIGT
jgi:hypothetical protein